MGRTLDRGAPAAVSPVGRVSATHPATSGTSGRGTPAPSPCPQAAAGHGDQRGRGAGGGLREREPAARRGVGTRRRGQHRRGERAVAWGATGEEAVGEMTRARSGLSSHPVLQSGAAVPPKEEVACPQGWHVTDGWRVDVTGAVDEAGEWVSPLGTPGWVGGWVVGSGGSEDTWMPQVGSTGRARPPAAPHQHGTPSRRPTTRNGVGAGCAPAAGTPAPRDGSRMWPPSSGWSGQWGQGEGGGEVAGVGVTRMGVTGMG